ncbi:MAG: rhomboid family intramembrane serine protease [Gammaproteobacteria bacterium]|jgi:membrane associated rhomboid family serine protease
MEIENQVDILFCPDRVQCNDLVLVLAAQSIPAQVRWGGRFWILSVPSDSVAVARAEIKAFTEESRRAVPTRPPVAADGRPWPGIIVYAVVLVLMALISPEMGFGVDWLAAGRMDGGRMLAGEWWRPVTALTLHADAAHLLGNLLFGGFFAYSVCRYFGGGFGWLTIVACGVLGNVANGFLAGQDHRSLGASTAVFAALGLLSGYLWRRGFPSNASRREQLAPVIAGIGLLAFTGTGGENTDIGAHLLGFVAGFGGGIVIARTGVPRADAAQLTSAFAAAGLIVAAWGSAVLLAA